MKKRLIIYLIAFIVLILIICTGVILVNYFGIIEKPGIPYPKIYPDDVIAFNKQFEKYEPLATYTGDDIIKLVKIVNESNINNPNFKIKLFLDTLEINEGNIDIIDQFKNYVHMNRGYDSTGRINLIKIASKNYK